MNKEINTTKIAIFRKREIRKTIHNIEWWFVVNDVVSALTDSPNVQYYIKKMRKRDNELSKGWGQFVTPLSVKTSGGDQKLNCANQWQKRGIKEQKEYEILTAEISKATFD